MANPSVLYYFLFLYSHFCVNDTKGHVVLSSEQQNLVTLVMKVHLFGMRQTYHMRLGTTVQCSFFEVSSIRGNIFFGNRMMRSFLERFEAQDDLKEDGPPEWISYWKPNVTINLVDDFTRYGYLTSNFLKLWDKLITINDTISEVPLHLQVSPISVTKWRLFLDGPDPSKFIVVMVACFRREPDELKIGLRIYLIFLAHIQFWNKNKSMEEACKISGCELLRFIVFLYLLDNDTSWMILASSGVGCCIESWKIGKVMHIEIDRSGRIPMLRFPDRESYLWK
ncbi:hypothetical protein H5410_018058 [Solanum commersonii]|uniref:Uncharacterized protein n=1 Tax=Solanum commersonii TaxID=4109 RepID=A0A9J6A1R1_SOLCO|nr:hypothetical protein H5410_018058 [Solanum commersonii]